MRNSLSKLLPEAGMTLVEVLASIVILAIISVSLIPIFVTSSQSNQTAKNITNATYLAESEMEKIINLNNNSSSPSLTALSDNILNEGYHRDSSCTNCYGINKDGDYVLIELKSDSAKLGKAVVKIYENDKKEKQEAQMETILSWEK